MQRAVRIVVARRHVLQDGFKERFEGGAFLREVFGRPAFERRRVNDGEIELGFGGAELVEQIECVIDDPVRTRAVAVDLVDDDDGFQSQRQRLARDEARLRHRAFDCIDQQQHAVYHRQHALDFAAEVGMAGGVDDVDVRAFVGDRTVLGENGDAALFLEVVAVHHAFFDVLVGGERAGLTQQLVDQRGFAVVNVGDNGEVTNSAHGATLGGNLKSARV